MRWREEVENWEWDLIYILDGETVGRKKARENNIVKPYGDQLKKTFIEMLERVEAEGQADALLSMKAAIDNGPQ